MPTKYATAHELESYKETIQYAEHVESDPGLTASISDRAEFKKRKQDAQSALSAKAAPGPKDDAERAALRVEQSNLEAFIKLGCTEINKPDMPTQHEMWDTPAGAVGKHRQWEHAIKNYTLDQGMNVVPAKDGYGAIFKWKDNQRRLRGEEEEWDGDIANVEKLRPQNKDNSSFADYRKLVTAGSPAFKEKYDEVFPDHEPTPVEKKLAIRCAAKKKNGDPCKSFPMEGGTFCRLHQEPQSEVATQPAA